MGYRTATSLSTGLFWGPAGRHFVQKYLSAGLLPPDDGCNAWCSPAVRRAGKRGRRS
jgi:hypothetical protein